MPKYWDLTGYSVIPGLVGMHNHLYYTADLSGGAPVSWSIRYLQRPRLYLAAGSPRCGLPAPGALRRPEPQRKIDAGQSPGPKIDVTAPHLRRGSILTQVHELTAATMRDAW